MGRVGLLSARSPRRCSTQRGHVASRHVRDALRTPALATLCCLTCYFFSSLAHLIYSPHHHPPTYRSNSFKGEFKVTTQNLLGKAELKRLRTQLMDEFPSLTKKMLDKVLPKDVDVNLLKCSNGTQLYVPGEGPPAFFDDGFGGVYPTLFTLWKLLPAHVMPGRAA